MPIIPAYTLHQLCTPPSMWSSFIEHIRELWQSGDGLILLGPAAQGIIDLRLISFDSIYVLQADLEILGIPATQIGCKILSYDDWAQLVLQYQRHISWK